MRGAKGKTYKVIGWALFVLTFGVFLLYLVLPTDPGGATFWR
jgi:hypothetical protein